MGKKSSTLSKRKLRVTIYTRLLNYTCADPECNSGYDIEAHHIRPLFQGGEDTFWNLISLCSNCHRRKKLHSEDKMLELYVYKSMHEAKILGFYMDEKEEMFQENYLRALRENKKIADDERFVYSQIESLNA